VWFFTPKIFASDADTVSLHVPLVHPSILRQVILEAEVKWISVPFALEALRRTTHQQNIKNMVGIV